MLGRVVEASPLSFCEQDLSFTGVYFAQLCFHP